MWGGPASRQPVHIEVSAATGGVGLLHAPRALPTKGSRFRRSLRRAPPDLDSVPQYFANAEGSTKHQAHRSPELCVAEA